MDSSLMLSFVSAAIAAGSLGWNVYFSRSRDRADRERRIREEVQAVQKLRATVDLVDKFNEKLATNYDALFSQANMARSGAYRLCKEQTTKMREELASIRKFVEDALAQNPQKLSDCASEITGHQECLDARKEHLRTEIASVEAKLRQPRRQG